MAASAGTFVGAAFETAGLYYQSYALDLLSSPLDGLVVLAFIVGVIGALTAIAIQGGTRTGLLLLLGPCIYLVVAYQRTVVPSVEWRDARTEEERKSVEETARSLTADKVYQARTSSVFANFDRLVSAFVAQTSQALKSADSSLDVGMIVRSQLLGFMMTPEVTDPGLKELLHLSLLGECRAMVQAGQEMADFRNRPAERCEWARSYSVLAGNTNFKLTPNASKYIAGLDVDLEGFFSTPVVDDLDEELGKLQTELGRATPPVTCDVSGRTGAAPSGDASTLAEAAIARNAAIRNRILAMVGGTTNGLPRSSDSVAALDAYFDERDARVNARIQELSSESFTCHELWNISYLALHYEAAMALETVKSEGEKLGFDKDALVEELQDLTGVNGTRELIRAISRKLFRLEFARGSASAIVQEYARRGPEVRNIDVSDMEDIHAKLRQESLENEWTGQASLIQTAMMLPYYQGLILFFLAVAFPFFALLLAIPGRAFGFFYWFGLWFWVKSWDIGYALVSMLDRVLYSVFVVKLDNGYAGTKTVLDLDFSTAVSALREVDPTFDVGTYYGIMGVCLMAVPVVSAQLTVQVASTLANVVRGQLRIAQQSATRNAAKLYDQRALGSDEYGDITARALDQAAQLVPLSRPLKGVTVIEDHPDPATMPRTPNLISTSSRHTTPAVLTNGTQSRSLATNRRQISYTPNSRWEMIEDQSLDALEIVDATLDETPQEQKALDRGLDSNGQPRLPGGRS